MTQEEKQILLKDLCARLPYNIIMNGKLPNNVGRDNIDFVIEPTLLGSAIACGCKPYLRPMSSMTEEESAHLQTLHNIISCENYGDGFSPAAWKAILDFNNYCCEHHLDNGGLIPMGLAIEAREGMYNIKTTCDICKDKNYCSQSEYVKTNCCKLKL